MHTNTTTCYTVHIPPHKATHTQEQKFMTCSWAIISQRHATHTQGHMLECVNTHTHSKSAEALQVHSAAWGRGFVMCWWAVIIIYEQITSILQINHFSFSTPFSLSFSLSHTHALCCRPSERVTSHRQTEVRGSSLSQMVALASDGIYIRVILITCQRISVSVRACASMRLLAYIPRHVDASFKDILLFCTSIFRLRLCVKMRL